MTQEPLAIGTRTDRGIVKSVGYMHNGRVYWILLFKGGLALIEAAKVEKQ
jgi:hypothetical protein